MAVIRRFTARPRRPVPLRRVTAERSARPGRVWLCYALCLLVIAGGLGWNLADRQAGPAETIRCTALRVIDGDTLDCAGRRIRLAGIDAPEMPGHCRAGRACVRGNPFTAKSRLQQLSASGIACRARGEDRYGRTIARCRAGQTDLSCAMIASGHAEPRYGPIFCSPVAARG